jgi:NADH:ubiquinone oxidoreductase subunit E
VKTRYNWKKLQQMDFEIKGVECLGACGYAPMMQLVIFTKNILHKKKSIINY